jgi:hypothetical protein
MIRRWLRIDWSEPLTCGWSFYYDNAGAFYIEY